MTVLQLSVLERGVRVECDDPAAHALLRAAYGAMEGDARRADLAYRIRRGAGAAAFSLERRGRAALDAKDEGHLLALFDEDITVALQRLRPDLYVLHAAVLTYRDAVVMLVAPSGGGKSTLCWALLQHGFRYTSDELAPVELATLDVHPYPRTLILKREPAPPYQLPARTLRTSRGFHVAAGDLPASPDVRVARLTTVFFLDHRPQAPGPALRPVSAAEAGARLFANALNPLAHEGGGLDGAIRIARGLSSFELVTHDLGETCRLVRATLDRP